MRESENALTSFWLSNIKHGSKHINLAQTTMDFLLAALRPIIHWSWITFALFISNMESEIHCLIMILRIRSIGFQKIGFHRIHQKKVCILRGLNSLRSRIKFLILQSQILLFSFSSQRFNKKVLFEKQVSSFQKQYLKGLYLTAEILPITEDRTHIKLIDLQLMLKIGWFES